MGQVAGIYWRRSIKRYLNEELQVGILEEVKDAIKGVKKLYDYIDMDIHLVEDGIRFQKVIAGGVWSKIKAPHYIVVTSEKKEGYLLNIGFALESIILSLANVGIGTSFITKGIDRELALNMLSIKTNHQSIVALSFGYPRYDESKRRRINLWKKRMEIGDFVSGYVTKTWQHILDSVRMAPSAMHTQPWKFFMDKNVVDIYSRKKSLFYTRSSMEFNRIALGSVLYHLYISANGLDTKIEIKRINGKEKSGYTYITSLIEATE